MRSVSIEIVTAKTENIVSAWLDGRKLSVNFFHRKAQRVCFNIRMDSSGAIIGRVFHILVTLCKNLGSVHTKKYVNNNDHCV